MKYSSGFSSLVKSISLALGVFWAVGCGRGESQDNLFQIPWPNEKGEYSLQTIPIVSFDQPHTLQGRFARIFVNPFTRQGQLESDTPIGRFIRSKDGVHIPADYSSLQAAVIHAHFERLQAMDKDLGVELEWPVKIGIRSKVKDRSGVVRNNAIFDGRLNALLIVPYASEGLPIAVNAGILAHEHFHMIFQRAVMNRVTFRRKERLEVSHKACQWGAHRGSRISVDDASDEDPAFYPSLFNEFKLRALNEGLADFWAWVYTGDVNFIEPSLPSEAKLRRLDFKVRQVMSRESMKNLVFRPDSKPYNDRILGGNAYRLGTIYARVLRELALTTIRGMSEEGEPSFEQRLKVAAVVVKALPSVAEQVSSAEADNQYLSANAFLKALYENWPDRTGEICRMFQRLAASDEDGFSTSIKCPKPGSEEVPSPAVMGEGEK